MPSVLAVDTGGGTDMNGRPFACFHDNAAANCSRSHGVPISVLEAIKMGVWDYEPPKVEETGYQSTRALPGSDEKLQVLAERLQNGLPLWHPRDSRNYADLTGDHD